jgi:hypothetical protein
MKRSRRPLSFLPFVLTSIAVLPILTQQAHVTGRSFEVASVKPSVPGEIRTYGPRSGDRFVAINCTLKTVIALAYNVREDKISGGPDWIGTDRWTIEAKAAEAAFRRNRGLILPFQTTL